MLLPIAMLALPSLTRAEATPAPAVAASACADAVDPSSFASAEELRRLNAQVARFGLRSTASPQHERMIDWLEHRPLALPGVGTRPEEITIKRWQPTPHSRTGPGRDLARAGRLAVIPQGGGAEALPTAGAIRYSQPTGSQGQTAPLTYLPAGTAITPENARGRIVICDVRPPSVPYAMIAGLSYTMTPDFAPSLAAGYERPFMTDFFADLVARGPRWRLGHGVGVERADRAGPGLLRPAHRHPLPGPGGAALTRRPGSSSWPSRAARRGSRCSPRSTPRPPAT